MRKVEDKNESKEEVRLKLFTESQVYNKALKQDLKEASALTK